jgi:hypothetical protein
MDNIVSKITDSPTKALAGSLASAVLAYAALKGLRGLLSTKTSSHSYPPGPPQDFLIGAMRSFPTGSFLFERFCEWASTYGMCRNLLISYVLLRVLLT